MGKESNENRVSIIIPIYNAEKYLSRCIKSVLQQTYKNLEIILVDDGSTDNSLHLCEELEKIDSRIILLHHENRGVSYTRNCGLDYATGDYITFIDADDWIVPEYIAQLLLSIKKYEVEISMCGYYEAHEDKCSERKTYFAEGVLKYTDALNMFSPYYIGAIWGKMFSKKALQNSDGTNIRFDEDISIGEDQIFWVQAVLNVRRIYATSKPLYYYYFNENSAMRTMNFEKSYMDFCARKKIGLLLHEIPELSEANLVFQTLSAAQAIAIYDFGTKDKRILELKQFLSANWFILLRHSNIPLKEKVRVLMANMELTRKILHFAIRISKQRRGNSL